MVRVLAARQLKIDKLEAYEALPFLAASGFFEMLYLTTNQTLLQLSIPDALRGRVAAGGLEAFRARASMDVLGRRWREILGRVQ